MPRLPRNEVPAWSDGIKIIEAIHYKEYRFFVGLRPP